MLGAEQMYRCGGTQPSLLQDLVKIDKVLQTVTVNIIQVSCGGDI